MAATAVVAVSPTPLKVEQPQQQQYSSKLQQLLQNLRDGSEIFVDNKPSPFVIQAEKDKKKKDLEERKKKIDQDIKRRRAEEEEEKKRLAEKQRNAREPASSCIFARCGTCDEALCPPDYWYSLRNGVTNHLSFYCNSNCMKNRHKAKK